MYEFKLSESNMYGFKCVNVASKVKIAREQSQLKICPFALNVKAAVQHTSFHIFSMQKTGLNIKTKINLYSNFPHTRCAPSYLFNAENTFG